MKSWYLIHSKPRAEKLAQEHLQRQGYRVYLPLILGRTKQRGRTVRSIQAMFPRYLFIHLSDKSDDWGPIRSTIGVSNLVRFGMKPAVIPDCLIQDLRQREDAEGLQAVPIKKLKMEVKVRIAEGLFEGYEGIYTSKTSKDRVIILLKIAENKTKVEIELDKLEPI